MNEAARENRRHIIEDIDEYIREWTEDTDGHVFYDISKITCKRVVILLQEWQSIHWSLIDFWRSKSKVESITIISPKWVSWNSVELWLQNLWVSQREQWKWKSRDISVKTLWIDGNVEVNDAANAYAKNTWWDVELRNIKLKARTLNTWWDSRSLNVWYSSRDRGHVEWEEIWRWNSVHTNTQWNSIHQQVNGNAGTFWAQEVFAQWVHDLVLQDITNLEWWKPLWNQHVWWDIIQLKSKKTTDQPNTQRYLQVVSLDDNGVTVERINNALDGIMAWDPREEFNEKVISNWGRYIVDWTRISWALIETRNDVTYLINTFRHILSQHEAPDIKGVFKFKWEDIKYRLVREKQGQKQMKRLIFY